MIYLDSKIPLAEACAILVTAGLHITRDNDGNYKAKRSKPVAISGRDCNILMFNKKPGANCGNPSHGGLAQIMVSANNPVFIEARKGVFAMPYPFDSDPVSKAELTVVVCISIWRGADTEGDPLRNVHQYWSPDGRFLAEHDPHHYTADASAALSPTAA